MVHGDVGDIARDRHQIIEQMATQKLAVGVVAHRFAERLAQCLGDTTVDLSGHHHGIDHPSAVVDRMEFIDADLAGRRVDRNGGYERAVGDRDARLRVVEIGRFETVFEPLG